MIDAAFDIREIVITAERAPQEQSETAASVSVVDEDRIDRLGEPLVPAMLRLTPSVAVSTQGGSGALTEIRVRGAEANHTLLFVDGIRANDPAAGDAPRFELLNADIVSRIEVLRGPQSALWGSQAIGGVIAINGVAAGTTAFRAASEAGSFGFRRASVSGSTSSGNADLALALGWQRSAGIDNFGGGDRDAYRNLAARMRASWKAADGLELGASGFALGGRTQFDGYDPFTFARTHDLSTENRIAAGRLWGAVAPSGSSWRGHLAVSLLGSSNRNRFRGGGINRTDGARRVLELQAQRSFATGPVNHRVIGALDFEREEFQAQDEAYGGFTNQDRDRSRKSATVEWRADSGPLTADIAVRRDSFNRFADATTLRASLLARIGNGFSLAGSYGEGIAQPTFFDLYGFFPGNFAGNPALVPESSRGIELSMRVRRERFQGALTWFRQRLRNEIVDIFDPVTFVSTTANRNDRSRRSGVEAEIGWQLGPSLRLSGHYAYLDATEPGGPFQLREVRRPRHSGSLALDGRRGRIAYGASLAFTGARIDTDFDVFPADRVRLGAYWLAGARLGYEAKPGLELFARAANAFDNRYQDAFGYRTEGRSLHAGIRLAGGR